MGKQSARRIPGRNARQNPPSRFDSKEQHSLGSVWPAHRGGCCPSTRRWGCRAPRRAPPCVPVGCQEAVFAEPSTQRGKGQGDARSCSKGKVGIGLGSSATLLRVTGGACFAVERPSGGEVPHTQDKEKQNNTAASLTYARNGAPGRAWRAWPPGEGVSATRSS